MVINGNEMIDTYSRNNLQWYITMALYDNMAEKKSKNNFNQMTGLTVSMKIF